MPRTSCEIAHPTLVSRASAARPGTQGYTSGLRFAILALGPGSRSARASALAALVRDTRARPCSCPLRLRQHLQRQEMPPDALHGLDEACVAAGVGAARPRQIVSHDVGDAARARRRHRPVFFLLFTG